MNGEATGKNCLEVFQLKRGNQVGGVSVLVQTFGTALIALASAASEELLLSGAALDSSLTRWNRNWVGACSRTHLSSVLGRANQLPASELHRQPRPYFSCTEQCGRTVLVLYRQAGVYEELC